MTAKEFYQNCIKIIDPKKDANHEWFLSLIDDEKQKEYEDTHIQAVMSILRMWHIGRHKKKIAEAKAEIERIKREEENTAENYCKIGKLLASIEFHKKEIEGFKPFFVEPYFARMDLVDPIEGYNSYYIGRRGDVKLEIVDWRAPLARKYYQKSKISFSINEYDYKTILRRAICTKDGKVEDFKNEFLSVREYLTNEEIAGRDEEILFDPYLREIIKDRKEEKGVQDIIRTIQEKQYEIITCPERKDFVLQGCAGSGKTMIMLHRLSYLMYNNEDIKPRDVLMLTPSNSFNEFIGELSEILQLERVRTSTISDYFLQVLKNEKIDITSKISKDKEPQEYLKYLYSTEFISSVQKVTDKVFLDLYGLFLSPECEGYISEITNTLKVQLKNYDGIKNASLRLRRTVLGEIKNKKEGGFYYTKPFRGLMNCVLEVEDFLGKALKSDKINNQAYFYRQLMRFYRSATFIYKHSEKVISKAETELEELGTQLNKEIIDLKRYKQQLGPREVYMYAENIEAKTAQIKEIEVVKKRVKAIGEASYDFLEFYSFLNGDERLKEIGSGRDFVDVVRFFYKATVKKTKKKYGIANGKMFASDGYALCTILKMLNKELTPKYSFVFVDEGQDVSTSEYELLKYINDNASFDIFGDLEQNITPFRGVTAWENAFPNSEIFILDRNYRNTNQIVEYVASGLKGKMLSMGFDGPEVKEITQREINKFFNDKKGLKAIICAESQKEKYIRKSYRDITEKGSVSDSKINFMTVYESKGLEFTSVVAILENMTPAEKYIACTRALKELAIIK